VAARVRWLATRRLGATGGAAVAVGVLALLVRLPRALTDSFWQDEVASARILREPTFARMLGHVVRTESTPPLWYTLGWLVHHAGVSIHDVRLLSVLVGGVFSGLVVVLARRVLPLAEAVVAGLLTAVGSYFVAHGRELRAYELLALLTVAFAFAIEAEVRAPSRRHAVALVACTAAGLLTHYFFLFTLAAGAAWLWAEPEARRSRRHTSVALAAGAAAVLPWLPFALRQYHHHLFRWIGAFRGQTVVNTPFRLFTPVASHGVSAIWAPALLLAVAAVGSVVLWRSARGRLLVFLWTVPLALAGAAWLVGFRIYADRNLIGIGAFVAVALAAAVLAVPLRARTAAAAALACAAVAGFVYDQRIPSPSYKGLAGALVAEGWRVHDPVVVFGNFFAFRSPLEWYLPGVPTFTRGNPARATCRPQYAIADAPTARRLLAGATSRRRVGRYVVLTLDEPSYRLLRRATILAPPRSGCE
jgi:hypothetical protein